MTDNSHVVYNKKGEATTFVGKDAVHLFRAAQVASSLRLFAQTGIRPTRRIGPTDLMRIAKEYTGKEYKRADYITAANDLDKWVKEMKAALPAVEC